jgi:predicted RNA binding protein YcfA (HicA-like mRNA interferase family)
VRDGWYLSGGTGSHRQYRHPTRAGRVTIAHHAGQIIPPGTLLSIIRQDAAELCVRGLIEDGEPVLEEQSVPIVAAVDIEIPVEATA